MTENSEVALDGQQNEQVANVQETSSTEQVSEVSSDKRFSQSDIDEIINKRLAREKEEREALETNYRSLQAQQEELINHMRNFGAPKEQQTQQQPVFDPTRPITFEDIEAMRAAQVEQEKEQRIASQIEAAKKELENFEETIKQSELLKALSNPRNAQQYVGIAHAMERMDDAAKFMYYAQKNHSEEFNRLMSVKDPIEQIKALTRLEDKFKQAAKVPSVSGAPGIIGDDIEASDSGSFGGDVQAARKRLLGK